MGCQDFLIRLGEALTDPEDETFLLFSQAIPSQNLGFVDAEASSIDLEVGGTDITILQSPGVLKSDRQQGTTGAASKDNILFGDAILGDSSTVLELGCGISGLIPILLAPKIRSYIATDQSYTMKLLKQNILKNRSSSSQHRSRRVQGKRSSNTASYNVSSRPNIITTVLDWEMNTLDESILTLPTLSGDVISQSRLDVVIACDCIYNEALIQPFVATCVSACGLNQSRGTADPILCIVAQQLRSPEVFEVWLKVFLVHFKVWRMPDHLLSPELRENSGFVVHVGILRE
ncbi:MAG: hypothetical protein M1825_003614 [Sarcosagium campestre]|nr:MAG: hypothetical protein M1825_003614 [Sarcosagium campestre]